MRETKKMIFRTANKFRKKEARMGNAIKNKEGDILTEGGEIADIWKEYFERIF